MQATGPMVEMISQSDMRQRTFVGRQQELAELRRCLAEALSGAGKVCFVVGQAGSGKTALVRHFIEHALATYPDLAVAMGTSNAQTGVADPYLPFREALTMLTGRDAPSKGASKFAPENGHRLRAIVARSTQILVEVAPDLAGLFVPGGKLIGALGRAVAKKTGWMDRLERLVDAQESPVAEQGRIIEQYTAFLRRLSAEAPLILFLDDLQWADNASLNLLFHLGRNLENSRVLVLGAYRPNDVALGRDGERHPLEPVVNELTRYHGDISVDLDAIPEEINRQFVTALLDSEPNCLSDDFRSALYHWTGGHALFTVELLRMMKERGDRTGSGLVRDANGCWVEGPSLDWDALPARIEGVVEERIDRLDEDLREMLKVASVEGEEFSAEVIAQVRAIDVLEAVRRLSNTLDDQHQLVKSQGSVNLGGIRLSRYRFEHNLFQQYLYGELGPVERAYLHTDVGGVLETLFEGRTEPVAGQLARHFEEAGVPEKAAIYRLQAGNRAYRLSANQEALVHLNGGLRLLNQLPSGPERTRLELNLQTSLGTVLVVTQGYASPNVQQAYVRARELSRALGDPPLAIPNLYGLSAYHFVRAELQQAYEEGQHVLNLTQQVGNEGYGMGSLLVLGAAAMHRGELDRARKHLEEVVGRYDRASHHELAYLLGHDPAVGALSYLAFVRWYGGHPIQALDAKEAALAWAQELDHPYSQGYAASFAAMLLQMLRRFSECEVQAEAALQIGQEGRFPLWQAIGAITHGWAIVHQGRAEEGIVELAQGLAMWEGSGATLGLPYQRALLAEAFLSAGMRDKGLQALEGSFCCPEEVWWLPEQHRLRGELLQLGAGPEAEAEGSFRLALQLAGQFKARSMELRAAMSLARLLHRQGRTGEAQDTLAQRYARLSEGFDTPDLQGARELLDTLQAAR